MEVILENNPVIRKLWKEWCKKDKELSLLTKKERDEISKRYQWLFPKEKTDFVDLEPLYTSAHLNSNREKFHRFFYVVCNRFFSRPYWGYGSYYQFMKTYQKVFNEKCTSEYFPKRVLLVLAIMGYIKELDRNYYYTGGKDKNTPNHYLIDKDKVMTWEVPVIDEKGDTVTQTVSSIPEWEMTHTEAVTFHSKGEDTDRTSWSMHPDWLSERQYESICSLTVEEEGIKDSSEWLFNLKDFIDIYILGDKKREEIISQWISYQKLKDLSLHKVGRCSDDSCKPEGEGYAGRFYSPITDMKSADRHRYLRQSGELVTEVDISSAQPSFLGIMMYKMTGVKSEWLRQALNGTFYEWIKEKTNTQEDRDTIKQWMMQFLYSCYQPNLRATHQGEHKPTYEFNETKDPTLCFQQRLCDFLEKNEPVIYKVIDWYKRHPVYRKDKPRYKTYVDANGVERKKQVGQGKWCSKLSYDLVKMETIFMKACIKELPDDIPFITIHDCLAVKESDSLKVKEIMEQVSREMYGEDITLRLKRENTSEDYS